MSNLKYAAIYDDEQWVSTSYHDTEAGAKQELLDQSGEAWEDLKDTYSIQGFTPEEIKEIDERSDRHPQ